jgi:glycerol-3-phosphate acyltransferase PlsY
MKKAMHNYLVFAGLICCAYLMGSIPFGYLIAKRRGVDIRTLGSGNIGGTNITRNLGFKWGLLVAFLDLLKGFLPAILARIFIPVPWQGLSISIMPIIGTIYPVFLGFKGGKGVAAAFGTLLAWLGPVFFIIWLVIWYLAVKLIKLMSLVNLVMALLFPLIFWLVYHSALYAGFGALLCLILWWSHRANIRRLITGTETETHY